MIERAFGMIQAFLINNYDALDFSYDFPDFLVENYDEMYQENAKVTEILNDNIPDICEEYEIGQASDDFIRKIKTEYKKAIDYINIAL